MLMEKNYNHKQVEEGKFEKWKKDGYFDSSNDLSNKNGLATK